MAERDAFVVLGAEGAAENRFDTLADAVRGSQPGDTIDRFVTRFKKYSAYTHLFNLTGQPSASIPMGLSNAGLPLAAMLSARNGEDALLMSVCAQLERAAPWFDHRPPLVT